MRHFLLQHTTTSGVSPTSNRKQSKIDSTMWPDRWAGQPSSPRPKAAINAGSKSSAPTTPRTDGRGTIKKTEPEQRTWSSPHTVDTVADEDNSEKSAYTNSFKRAASKWGFGRDLYNQGMPAYVADLYTKSNKVQIEPRVFRDDEKEAGYTRASNAEVQTRQQPVSNGGQRFTNLNPPTTARQAFPWVKNIEKHFGTSLLPHVNDFCKVNFNEWKLGNLSDQQISNLATWVIGQVKTWPQYDGCFDSNDEIVGDRHVTNVGDHGQGSPMGAVVDAILNDSSRTPRGNMKRAIIATAKAAIFKQTGREARENEIMGFVGDVAASSKNSLGIQGEVLRSLRDCEDDQWLSNILANAKIQMVRAADLAEVVENDSDNPF